LKNLLKAGEKPADMSVQTPTKYLLTIYCVPRRGGDLVTQATGHTTCAYQLHYQTKVIAGFPATIQANRQ
jgi:hypothetical protein